MTRPARAVPSPKTRTSSIAPRRPAGPEAALGWAWRAAALALLAIVPQLPALSGGFVWDDVDVIPQGELIRASDGLYAFWFTTRPHDYWPLAYTTHWIEWRIWGDWAPGYRAVNLALHALNVILAWRILTRLRVPGAWLCGAIFAVHPVTVEAVAWILQRKTLLSTACAFGSLLCFLRFADDRRRGWYAAALVLFALGMLCKSSIVMWPFVLLLCRWWQTRRVGFAELLLAGPFLGIAVGLGAVGVWFQYHRAIGAIVVRDDGLWSRLALAGHVVWFYLGKACFPARLAFVYPRWELSPTGVMAVLPDLALTAVFGLLAWQRRSWGAAGLAGLGYYVLNLVPVMGFFNIFFMRYSLVADHWQYLALPGLIALVVGSAAYALQRRRPRYVGMATAFVVIGLLAAQTHAQASLYSGQDNDRLWFDTLAKYPNAWLAHDNLGYLLTVRKQYDEAIVHYRDAARLNPTCAETQNGWGWALAHQGNMTEALAHYRQAIRISPKFVIGRQNLASALWKLGHYDEALVHLEEAARHASQKDELRHRLASLLLARGRRSEAISNFEQAIAVNPDRADSHISLARILAQDGQTDAAVAHYQRALETAPHRAEAQAELGALLGRQRRYAEAIFHYRQAIAARPNQAALYFSLGLMLVESRQLEEAIERYRQAIALKPDYREAHLNLANAYALAGRFDAAMAAYAEALKIDPDYAAAHLNLASVLTHQGKHAAAIEHYRDAVRANPKLVEAQVGLAGALAGAEQSEEAITHYQAALELAPNLPTVHNKLGALLLRRGQVDEATRHFEAALRIDPEDAEARANLEKATGRKP